MKMVFCGVVILLFGILWYLRDTNYIALEPFWPIVAMLAGLIMVLKGFMFKQMKKK
jgi:glucan phosphoethanolaminetransferase (alkaline phosphatase superfamily)